jgi:TRAP-type mannitol/chloroaromatic compound transport system permease small subunit
VTFIKADNGPGFFELYGSILFLMVCVVFAAYVYQPFLGGRWDVNNSSNENKYMLFYIFYIVFCVAFYHYLIRPTFNIPDRCLWSICI